MSEYFWPAGLPQFPQRPGFTPGRPNNTTSFEMELGPPKTRRRTSANVRSMAATYFLSEENTACGTGEVVNQKELFYEFYEIVDCNLSFWLPDPEKPSRYIKVKIKAKSEKEGPEVPYQDGKIWAVNLQLTVWPYAYRPRS